jgi:hypothetical protein
VLFRSRITSDGRVVRAAASTASFERVNWMAAPTALAAVEMREENIRSSTATRIIRSTQLSASSHSGCHSACSGLQRWHTPSGSTA